jgi:HK97 family phage portal protein
MSTLWSTAGLGSLIDPKTLTRQVWDAQTARSLPGMGRALGIYRMLVQCELDGFRQTRSEGRRSLEPLPQIPRLLERPDPDLARPTFIGAHIEDWILHGNAIHYVTAFDASGWPAACRYYPAHRWTIQPNDRWTDVVYQLDGREVDRSRVVHVQRGIDPDYPFRGVGVVEQHLRTLNRAGLQEAAETSSLTDRGMPSVAIITPNPELDPDANDLVADKWVERFAGSEPKPAFLPKDTQVIPLSWNPSDSQMVEARQMSLIDVANVMNLDPYYLGAPGSSHTYKSPGPMFLALLRTTLEEVFSTFEDEWSFRWLPRGQRVRFDRTQLLRDDLGSMLQAFTTGSSYFPDKNEPRAYMGFPALPEDAFPKPPEIPAPAPTGTGPDVVDEKTDEEVDA